MWLYILYICTGELLTDKHINFAQKLVGYKFKNICCLQLTLTLYKATRVPAKCVNLDGYSYVLEL